MNLIVFHQWRQLRVCGIQLAGQLGEILSQTEDPPALLDTDMAWRAYVAFREIAPRPPLSGTHAPL